ncbi:hypothetical protein SAMD00079811_49610 [Scytonema sp. HK-05]|uniref:hypothetical protein n=1 Tax=Scytonema sp. HK-05 TaxID=1137095 RepID=UPI0009356ABE|nr:hypothetical protein [Scytonema sp. HK-05]OKH52638.1 hypothetical protein NIES2130_31695 [Scytonema sp. HK-05]BAY47343.1 hypothetical protein SAMD00079811_49610 [Scytonema sp. HK-05]
MQAYKLNATVDESGHLIIDEPLNIAPGKVEVIILQSEPSVETFTETQTQPQPAKPKRVVECSIPILKEWLESTEPTPSDFDPEQAKWEYLKEKHNL